MKLTKKEAEKIFLKNKLGKVESVKKIEIGFTNRIYLLNDKFILKICEDKSNEKNFEKEAFFYNFFKNKLPVPKITVYDNSNKIYNRHYIIYSKIEGDNLYSKWHLLKNKERKEIVKQTCKYLKIINNSNYKNFIKRFKINCPINWQNKILTRIKKHLDKAEKRKLLKKDLIENIKEFVELNKKSLRKQKMALVYWDIHFDNILINNKKIVGILDFERTELASIDFTLDIVKRMVDYPKKYMAEKFEKLARKKDYEKLLNWFEEFYPDLFKFKDLDSRLALYSLEHDLDTLLWYPKSKDVRKMIAKTVGFKLK